jgi:hypothetical protein
VGNPVSGGDPTPGGSGSLLDASAFARPARGETGDAARYLFKTPAITNWNLALFKNFPIANGRRGVQLRAEAYNLLNQTQFGGAVGGTGGTGIDNTVRFDAAGTQVNANFGKATAARNPRILQGSIRFTF